MDHRCLAPGIRCALVLLLCGLLLSAVPAAAQQPGTWQEAWHELYGDDMSADADAESAALADMELLDQLAAHPIDLNSATRDDLEQLPFLSPQQVADLLAYRDRYAPMRSMGELRMVRSLGYEQVRLIPFFTFIATPAQPTPAMPRLDTMLHRGRHELTATGRVPFYTRKGDRNGYLGYRYRHELRYDFAYGQQLRFGLVAAQDAGEPFFSSANRWGYDYYSYYLQLKPASGQLRQLVVGKYRVSVGQGLTMGSSFALGKLATLQSLGRRTTLLRPHASRSEADYLQGAAATLRLGRSWELTAWGSWRPLDATLGADATAATLVGSGYHRTPAEMQKKGNTHATDAGAHVAFRHEALRVGLTAVYTHLDRTLQPDTRTLYRRHWAAGRDFANVSCDYSYLHHRFSLGGETAVDREGHLATHHTLSFQAAGGLGLFAQQRFYSYRYHSLRAHSQSEGGRVQNESALMVGGDWSPASRLHLQAYADYAYFPWARYLVSQSSSAVDAVVAPTLELGRVTLRGRYRWHRRYRDNETKTALQPVTDQRLRLSVAVPASGALRLTTQADLAHSVFRETSRGIMLSEQLTWQRAGSHVALTAAWFCTDDYQSRVYLYERQLAHQFAFPSYYGRGLRLALAMRTDIGTRLRIAARLGHTRYFDRSVVGSALQQVDHSTLTDLDLQMRLRL